MTDLRDGLEHEIRRHRLPSDALERVADHRRRRQRNRRLASGLVALVVAGAGIGGGLYAVRSTGPGAPGTHPGRTALSPVAPSPVESPSQPVAPAVSTIPFVSGPIQFVDANRGWMAGAAGEILSTNDGGHAWTAVYSGPFHVSQLDFIDAEHGWALTDSGFLRTTDGGATWEEIITKTLSSVQFLTADVGWGIEVPAAYPPNLGHVLETTDGGETWHDPGQPLDALSVCFSGDRLGWAAGAHEAGAALFRTEDGGASWDEIPLPIPGGDQGWASTVRCGGDGSAWVLTTADGAAGHVPYVVFRTREATSSYDAVLQEPVTRPMGEGQGIADALNPMPGPLLAFDGLRGGVVTSCPACGAERASVSYEQTYDAGGTWYPSTVFGSDPPAGPLGASFLDPDHGWVLMSVQGDTGLENQVLMTTDGGATWTSP